MVHFRHYSLLSLGFNKISFSSQRARTRVKIEEPGMTLELQVRVLRLSP